MTNTDFLKTFNDIFGNFQCGNNHTVNGHDEYVAENADELTQMMYSLVRGKTELKLKPIRNSNRVAICNRNNEVLHTFDDVMSGKRGYIMMVIGEFY